MKDEAGEETPSASALGCVRLSCVGIQLKFIEERAGERTRTKRAVLGPHSRFILTDCFNH
jgi:hypothetical protein